MQKNIALPFPLTVEPLIEWVWTWLNTSAEYSKEPDQDGSNKKGFTISTGEYWNGHIDDSHYGVFSVEPNWQMYGK